MSNEREEIISEFIEICERSNELLFVLGLRTKDWFLSQNSCENAIRLLKPLDNARMTELLASAKFTHEALKIKYREQIGFSTEFSSHFTDTISDF